MKVIEIIVDPTGDARGIYDDDFDFGSVGQIRIQRASRCEPDAQGRWNADLSPIGGPTLGPFSKRRDALAAEVQWLRRQLFPG